MTDKLEVPGYGTIEVSIVDAANPLVFVRARDLGLTGSELPLAIDTQPELLAKMLVIREVASVACGITTIMEQARAIPAVPKLCFVAESTDYQTVAVELIPRSAIDIQARMLSMGKLHPVLAITGGICIGIAAKIPGTIMAEMVGQAVKQEEIRIGDCIGILAVGADVIQTEQGIEANSGTVFRTSRILMRGEVRSDCVILLPLFYTKGAVAQIYRR